MFILMSHLDTIINSWYIII